MNAQVDMFDPVKAEFRREAGIRRVTNNNLTFLDQARQVARELLATRETITADDVRKACADRGIKPNHYNAWGALFSCDLFEHTGDFTKSTNVRGHGNLIRVWRSAR